MLFIKTPTGLKIEKTQLNLNNKGEGYVSYDRLGMKVMQQLKEYEFNNNTLSNTPNFLLILPAKQ